MKQVSVNQLTGEKEPEALIIGLTGGIGSGKSTVSKMLEKRGATIIDADLLAREAVRPGGPAIDLIRRKFGDGVIDDRGNLIRKKLGKIVFSDPLARKELESILHPAIQEITKKKIRQYCDAGQKILIYEAPLIVEKNMHHDMDGLIVVAVDRETQLKRAMLRDHADKEDILARINSQLPLERKIREATWVLYNDRTLQETESRVEIIWKEILDVAEKKAMQQKENRKKGRGRAGGKS